MDRDIRPASPPAESLSETTKAKIPTPITQNFQTPEEVAAADAVTTLELPDSKPSKFAGLRDRFKLKRQFDKREFIIGIAVVLVCGSITAFVLNKTGDKPVASADIKKPAAKVVPKPTTVPSTLSGLPVAPEINKRPVTGIMIENSPASRPQSGLSEAGVVFEAIAEGGITRFLALFQDTAPGDIGPVRSARPYYVQWAQGFDAGYAHVGGSPDALAMIRSQGVKDLDQFQNSGSYRRVGHRSAPHNVYTDMAAMHQLQASKGYTSSTFNGFTRKKASPAKQVTARTIDLKLSGAQYDVHYDYNAASNSYNRVMAGGPHMDANGSRQISPSVVVAMVTPYSLNGKYSVYQTIGSGQAYVFQDGVVTVGTWTKPSEKAQVTFTDAAGKSLLLNPGQTWLTAVTTGNVSYTP